MDIQLTRLQYSTKQSIIGFPIGLLSVSREPIKDYMSHGSPRATYNNQKKKKTLIRRGF